MRKDFAAADKLKLLELMIEQTRSARNPEHESHTAHMILRALASDVRAGMAEKRTGSFRVLAEHVDRARRARARIGYLDVTVQQAIAAALLAHWPTVEQAFRRAAGFEEVEAERDLYQLMAHDVSAPAIIAAITEKFPAIAERWSKVPAHVETDDAIILTGERTT